MNLRTLILTIVLTLPGFVPVFSQISGNSNEPPLIPVGLDAYTMWDLLPYQKIGIRANMRSTYDRTGMNTSADASNFLYQEADDFNVSLDVKGPGVLYFVRTNHFHGSPWHYEIDGNDMIVKETATDDPADAKTKYKETKFIPKNLFPSPLTMTWTTTKGADLMWVPIPYEKSFRLAYGRTLYGTGYYIYHTIPKGTQHLSKPLETYKKESPDKAAIELFKSAGTDIAPKGKGIKTFTGTAKLNPYKSTTLADIEGPSVIRAFKLKIPRSSALDFGKTRLRVTWDNRWHASIDAPAALFFGVGHLYNSDDREYLVKGLPLNIKYDDGSVYLSCYWPMPFMKNARIELIGYNGKAFDNIEWEIRTELYKDPANHLTYFHATYTDHPKPIDGQDVVFLDTRQVEGGGDWSGHFVGMSWIFSDKGNLRVLEGDPRFYFDDSKTPQAWGTGSEEWGGGGDYWGGENMTIALAGHPVGKEAKKAENDLDLINSAYRFLVADVFPFGKNAKIALEHGGLNTINEHFGGVSYWYGIDSPSLVLTDQLNVSHKEDIEKHNYQSPTAGTPYALTSRYELGPDHDEWEWAHPKGTKDKYYGANMYFPAERDSVRTMKGTSQFTVKVLKDNLGVLLRRKFDYQYPNQEAKVYVRASGKQEWDYVGNWYTAGSNTYYYSYPKGRAYTKDELKGSAPEIRKSNRRWREEEFVISSTYSQGTESLDIKLEFVPNDKDLLPNRPFPIESAWSESRYWVYSYTLPLVELD